MLKKLCFVSFSLALLISNGCKKEQPKIQVKNEVANNATVVYQKEQDKLVKFLVITLGVKSNEVIFNAAKNNFTVRSLTFDRDTLLETYKQSNEYKAKYEN